MLTFLTQTSYQLFKLLLQYLSLVESWTTDLWLSPIGHSHLVLTSAVSLLLMVAFIGIFQKKWGDDVWSVDDLGVSSLQGGDGPFSFLRFIGC